MRFNLILGLLVFAMPAHATSTKLLVQMKPSTLRSLPSHCKAEVLNPHMGGDMLSVECSGKSALSLTPAILAAETESSWHLADAVTDPEFHDQWAFDTMNVAAFWSSHSKGDARIKVAIIDTGLDPRHEDLMANLAINAKEVPSNGIDDDENGFIDDIAGWDAYSKTGDIFDHFAHGTHIAGSIGATANNGLGIAGINWNVSIIPIKMFGPRGEASTETALRAIDYAVARGANILNLSWAGKKASPLLLEALNRCRALGILIVAAAGNETVDNDVDPSYPANFELDNILSVAAIDLHEELTWFSNWGRTTVHVAAPGQSILSTMPNNRYGFKDGTSMAVPQIVGAASLIWSAHPEWTYREVREYILTHCVQTQLLRDKLICGGYFRFDGLSL